MNEELVRFERFGLKQFDTSAHRRGAPKEFEDEAVLIIHQDPRELEGRKTYRFELSDEAARLLDVTPGESELVFSEVTINDAKQLVLINVTGQNARLAKSVTKSLTWSSRDDYIHICDNYPVSTKEGRHVCDLEFLKNSNNLHAATVKPRKKETLTEEQPNASAGW